MVEAAKRSWSSETWARLVRRAHVVAAHLRYHGQLTDAREVVERVLGQSAAYARYRALLEEAVDSFMRGRR